MSGKDVDLNIKAHDKTGAAFKSAQSNLQNLASSAAILDGPLSGISGRISAVAAALGRTSPGMIAFGVGMAGMAFTMKQALSAAIEYEKQMFRLEGALQATGYASGFTAKELDELAVELDRNTLAGASDVREGIAQMLVFKSVTGQTLKESIVLAQDWAAMSGKAFSQTSKDIARALDSYEGLSTVERRLNLLTPAQEELAKAMYEAGKMGEYQAIVIKGLHDKLDGVGAKEAQGLAGKIDGLALSWSLLLEELGTGTPASLGGSIVQELTEYSDGVRGLISSISDVFDPTRDTAKIKEMLSLAMQIGELESVRSNGPSDRADVIDAEDRINVLKAELHAISEVFVVERERAAALAAAAKKQSDIEAKQAKDIKTRTKALEDQEKVILALRTEEEKLSDQMITDSDVISNAITAQQALDGSYQATTEQVTALARITERYDAALKAIADKKQKPIDDEESRKQKGLEKLQESLMAEDELRQYSFMKKLEKIDEFAVSEDQAQQLRLIAAKQYADEEVRIYTEAQKKKQDIAFDAAMNIASIGSNLSSIFKDQSKQAFKTHQAFAITEATINTYVAATRAYRDTPGGPFAKFAAAAAITAAGFKQVHDIGAMSPGSSGSGGSAGSGGSSLSNNDIIAPAIRQQSSQRTTVEIYVEGVRKPITLDVEGFVEAVNNDKLVLSDGVTRNRIVASHG